MTDDCRSWGGRKFWAKVRVLDKSWAAASQSWTSFNLGRWSGIRVDVSVYGREFGAHLSADSLLVSLLPHYDDKRGVPFCFSVPCSARRQSSCPSRCLFQWQLPKESKCTGTQKPQRLKGSRIKLISSCVRKDQWLPMKSANVRMRPVPKWSGLSQPKPPQKVLAHLWRDL